MALRGFTLLLAGVLLAGCVHTQLEPAPEAGMTARDKKLLANGGTDVVVQPGKSVRVLLIAPSKGHYDLTCADHDWDGMVGKITVD